MKIRRQREEVEIPTASMADIAFLLIIFFMLTSAFAATRGVPYQLPDEEEKAVEGEPGLAIRVVDEGEGQHSLLVDGQPLELPELLPYVDGQLAREPDKPVLLYVDPEAPYSAMVRVYDELLRSEDLIGRRISSIYVPTSRDVEDYIRVFGYNPFLQVAP